MTSAQSKFSNLHDRHWISESYNQQYAPKLVSLLKEINPAINDLGQSAYINWQYHLNPTGPAIVQLAINKKHEIVGQYAVIPTNLWFNNNIATGTLSVNTIVRSDFRNQGIFLNLAQHVFNRCQENGILLTYGFPNARSYPGFIKIGFKDIGSAKLWIFPLRPSSYFSSSNPLLASLTSTIDFLYPSLINFWRRVTSKKSSTALLIEELSSLDGRLTDLWESTKNQIPCAVAKTTNYLDWRFMRCPTRKYHLTGAVSQGQLLAWIATRKLDIMNYKTYFIVDGWRQLNHAGLEAMQILMRQTISQAQTDGYDLVASIATSLHPLSNALLKSHFIACPSPLMPKNLSVILLDHSKKIPDQNQTLTQWALAAGDYDDF